MKNVSISTKGSIVTVTFDLSKLQGPSKSGKTQVIASTEGNVSLPGHESVKVGLNVYTTEMPAAPEAPKA